MNCEVSLAPALGLWLRIWHIKVGGTALILCPWALLLVMVEAGISHHCVSSDATVSRRVHSIPEFPQSSPGALPRGPNMGGGRCHGAQR